MCIWKGMQQGMQQNQLLHSSLVRTLDKLAQ